MKLLERRLTLYEEKYGILSEDFYAALMPGQYVNAGAHLLPEAGATQERSNCLDCQGLLYL